MIKLNSKMYDLTNSSDRESLHVLIDDFATKHFSEDVILNKETNITSNLDDLHSYISERLEDSMEGKWFDGKLEIEMYIDDIVDFFKDMGIDYYIVGSDRIEIDYDGYLYLFSRSNVKQSLANSYYKTFIIGDGLVHSECLSKIGINVDSTYYLAKNYK